MWRDRRDIDPAHGTAILMMAQARAVAGQHRGIILILISYLLMPKKVLMVVSEKEFEQENTKAAA